MRCTSSFPNSSKRHSSTLVALAENNAKLTPSPSHEAPRGYGNPSRTCVPLLDRANRLGSATEYTEGLASLDVLAMRLGSLYWKRGIEFNFLLVAVFWIPPSETYHDIHHVYIAKKACTVRPGAARQTDYIHRRWLRDRLLKVSGENVRYQACRSQRSD